MYEYVRSYIHILKYLWDICLHYIFSFDTSLDASIIIIFYLQYFLRLDQQLWGSDDEADDEEEDETNKDKEESGKGKPIDDKQFGAKDDKNNDEDESAENDDKKTKDKQKNDINEMDEPDYDEDHVNIFEH